MECFPRQMINDQVQKLLNMPDKLSLLYGNVFPFHCKLSSLIYCFIILKQEVEDKLGSHFRVSDFQNLWREFQYDIYGLNSHILRLAICLPNIILIK